MNLTSAVTAVYFCQLLLLKPSLLPVLLANVLTDRCFLCISYLSRKIHDFYTLTAVTFSAGRNIPAALTHHISFMLCLLFLVLREIIFFFWLIFTIKML